LVLHHLGLGAVVTFGTEPEATRTALVGVLGTPDDDSGWIDSFSVYGTCPGSQVRMIRWGTLQVFMTDADSTYSTPAAIGPHFFHYRVSNWDGSWTSLGLGTDEGMGLGNTVAELTAAYGADVEYIHDDIFDIYWFSIVGPGELGGTLTGPDATDTIHYLSGGAGCGE
jgi:hypothetical protein